ncbi:MAG: DUF3696 domain-containing protein [Symploca sp. SIO1B1]|nr:DUF3696 domain-containing protein [Symploca sp. SIO1B1]
MKQNQPGITAIKIAGYKSLYDESVIDISSLTILAGANSSGKSSIMQPVLLIKQTLEANYDPGALLLNGPNLKFTSAEQLLAITPKERAKEFKVGIEINGDETITCSFSKQPQQPIDLVSMEYEGEETQFQVSPEMKNEELIDIFPQSMQYFDKFSLKATLEKFLQEIENISQDKSEVEPENNKNDRSLSKILNAGLGVTRNRCFFEISLFGLFSNNLASRFQNNIQHIIHVPGLRGNPERNYKTTAVSNQFPGTFENYVASVINHWQINKDKNLDKLIQALQTLGLTSTIESEQINDTQVELKVGRLPCSSNSKTTKKDMVSIVDVGFGVSQVLPVLVALLAASPGQLVYIEQPELHLHPRAQVALAEVFAEAANRGVRVVVETHSELFLLGVQSLVAEEQLSSDKVKLHWFTQQEDGGTKISSAELDETGAFADWPEDFSEIALSTQNRYLTAAETKLWND